MIVDAQSLDKAAAYHLLIGVIVPRPIAWVGSRLPDGPDNLAPFSYFMGVQSQPPMLALSVSHGRGGQPKHTARNIRASGVFTVSLVEEGHLGVMHETSGTWAESEFDVTGLARAPGTLVDAPFVAEARVAMECRLHLPVDLPQATVFFGEVLRFHLHESLVDAGGLDLARIQAVGRLGGDLYALPGARVALPRVRVDPAKSS